MHSSELVGAPFLLLALVAAAALAGCRSNAANQTGLSATGLTDLGGYIEMKGLFRTRDQQSKSGGPDTQSDEMVLAETVKLETEGYIYHPNIVEYSVGVALGLLQSQFETTPRVAASGGDSGHLLEYDLTTDFLSEKIYPGTLQAHRFEGLEPRPFQTSVRRTTTDFGAQWSYLAEKVPTRVYWNLSDVFYAPLATAEENRNTSDEQVGVDSEVIFSPTNKLFFDFRHQETEKTTETHSYDVQYTIDDSQLRHLLFFGSGDEHSLKSNLQFFRQEGTTDLDRTQLAERLSFRHAENLRSWYTLDLRNRLQGSSSTGQTLEENSWYASAAVEHRLYENLVTELGGDLQQQVFDNAADFDYHQAYIDLDYYRNNPWGRLQVDARHVRNRSNRSGFDQRIVIIDEPHTFDAFFPIILDQEGVQTNTIVITDLSGTEIYRLDLDYTITVFANRVEIHRIPTGWIQDGQTVLLDYEILNVGEYSLDTASTRVGLRQSFDNGIAPYYRLMAQDQGYTSGGENNTPPEDILAHVIGIEYRHGNFTTQAEYEDYNSTIVPFYSYRISAGYSLELGGGKRAGLNTRWMDLTYEEPNLREAVFLSVDASYRHPFNPAATFEAVARYLDNRDTLNSDNKGVDLRLSQDWVYRSVEFRIILEVGRFENNFTRNDATRAYFELRRRF